MKRQNVLFPAADRALRTLGENLRLARRRRKITAQMMAERANLSLMTLRAIERGSPSVAMSHGGAGTDPVRITKQSPKGARAALSCTLAQLVASGRLICRKNVFRLLK